MGRRILVTGASRGIGRAIALSLAADGFDIVIHCRSNAALANDVKAAVEAFGVSCGLLMFDVADRDAARAALNAEIEANGPFYGVVCNAGITRDTAFPAMTDEEWDDVIDTNLNGFFNVVQPLVMPMVRAKKGGRIVVMSSVSGIMGNRGQVNYAATKAGLIGAAKSMAIELASRRITVNVVAPGIIGTDMTDSFPPEMIKQIVPMQRVGEAEEVASLVSYLCSDKAGYLTRQVISVNGGMM